MRDLFYTKKIGPSEFKINLVKENYDDIFNEDMVISYYGLRKRIIVSPGMPNATTYVDIAPHHALDNLLALNSKRDSNVCKWHVLSKCKNFKNI